MRREHSGELPRLIHSPALCEQLGLAPLPIETDAGLQALADPILDEEMARIASAN
jgi:hypothetical protein